MDTSWSDTVKTSIKAVLQDEQSRSEVVLSQMPEKKSDTTDVQDLCSRIDVSVRPTAVVRLGKDETKAPRPVKVTFQMPFDARIFLAKANELKKVNDDSIKKIHCRHCSSREEQARFQKQR
jgi:hypothetical protein